MQYEDFEVRIELVSGREYRIAVLHSPAGEAEERVIFPFDTLALTLALTQLENALLQSGARRRRQPTRQEQAVLDFGASLFDFLMTGEVGRRYDVSQDRCQQQGKGLRLKLRIQDAALAALPWEFLHDRRFDQYLALSQRTPLIRYLDLPRTLRTLPTKPPLRVLGMVASPTNLPELDIDVEQQRIENALAELTAEGLVELDWLQGRGWRDLQRAMRRGPWHMFHFIGHGGFDKTADEGYLVFERRDGEAHRMSATNLAHLLADHDPLRVVVLNACDGGQGGEDVFSSTAATLVRRGIPCVVAMQYTVSDVAAIEFARTFYEALADGLPTETAVSDARKSITFSMQHSLEWGTPVVFTHAPDGVLFDLSGAERQAPRRRETPAAEPAPTDKEDRARAGRRTRARAAQGESRPWRLNARGLPLIEAWEQLQGVDTLPQRIVWQKDQKEMVLIPAGAFVMGTTEAKARELARTYGADEKWYLAETPQRTLVLPAYYMDVTPVTHIEYARFLADNPDYRIPRVDEAWARPYNWNSERREPPRALLHHPVVLVSWEDATAYAQWSGKVLPAEEQWEKAARGADGREYPWGNDWDSARLNAAERLAGNEIKTAGAWNSWWSANKDELRKQINTTVVGQYPSGASRYGLLDASGNVWEWCDAWYDGYPGTGAQHEDFGRKFRVVRGGSWDNVRINVRCASRYRDDPHYGNDNVGIRCASIPF